MAIIKPKHGTTAPSSGLTQYELAVDTTNKRVYIGNAGGSGDLIGSAPGGSDTQVQFNDSGVLGGDAGMTYNKTTDTLTVGSLSTTGLEAKTVGGDEGGQIDFGIPATNTTLNTGVAIDVYQNRLRIYEKGGTSRGYYIDLTGGGASVGTNLVGGGGGGGTPGGSDTQVQFNDGGSTFGGDSGLTYNKTTDSLTITGDLAVNGGDITTSSATATIFNTTATTVSAFGDATTCTLGYSGNNSSTTNIATAAVAPSQVKTINIGTGGVRATVVNVNNGGLSSEIFLNANTYIGGIGGASPAALLVDTILNYSGSISITSNGNGVLIDDTASIEIGDFSANGDGTLLSVKDGSRAVRVYSIDGLQLQTQTQLRFYDADDSNYVGFKAPATVAADKMWILPSADGTTGQVLSTDGSGTLSWISSPPDYLLFNMGIV